MWSNQKMVLIKIDPFTKIYILTKFECSRARNKATRGKKANRPKQIGTKRP